MRFSRVLSLALLLSLLAAVPAVAQQVLQSDPRAVAIATRALAAMGAGQISATQSDFRASGSLTVYAQQTLTMPVTFEAKGLAEERAELQRPDGTVVRILRNGSAVLKKPDGTIQRLAPNNTVAEHPEFVPIFTLLAEATNPYALVKLVSTASTNGTPDDVISVGLALTTDPAQAIPQAGMTNHVFYINHASALLDKVEYDQYSEDKIQTTMKVAEIFSDYRNVTGVAVPFHCTTHTDGQLESELQLNSIRFNVGLPDSDFEF